jgi:hypothetical protein
MECLLQHRHLADESWIGIPAQVVLDAIEVSGFRFDCRTETGIVLLMLSGLAIDGCLIAFAEDAAPAQAMYDASCEVIAAAASGRG